jgi:catechol O-methyltransferase
VYSVELAAANAHNAHRIWAHAGVVDRITCVVGTIGDGGATLDALVNLHGFRRGSVDFVFIDHDKAAYLADLRIILDKDWLHPGSIVMADNMKIPGAPDYRAYMREQQDQHWRSIEHRTHGEYQALLPDKLMESEYLG